MTDTPALVRPQLIQQESERAMSEKYYDEVAWQVWRDGGDPDAVSRNRVDAAEDGGATEDETAALELRLQRARAAVERDIREWEANEWDLPADERFSR